VTQKNTINNFRNTHSAQDAINSGMLSILSIFIVITIPPFVGFMMIMTYAVKFHSSFMYRMAFIHMGLKNKRKVSG
jgi:hypothetical protein